MSFTAPFLASTATKKVKHPVIGLLVLLAILFVPTFVAALTCGQWCLTLLFSVVGAATLLVLCVVSLFSARFSRRFPLWTKPLTKLIVILAGLVLLMSPIALFECVSPADISEAVPEEHPFITILSAVYSAAKTIGLDLSPNEWTANGKIEGTDFPDFLLFSHAFLLLVYAIACPLAAVFAAFDAVVNGMSGPRIRFWSFRKSLSTTKSEIYVFHELDEHGATLAHNIIQARQSYLPLIIFANVGDLEASRDDTLMEDLIDKATGRAFVLFTSLPAQSIPSKLSKRALNKCTIRYFAISENSSTNMQTAISLWDAVFKQLWNETWHIEGKQLNRPFQNDYASRCNSIAEAMKLQAMSTEAKSAAKHEINFQPSIFDPVMGLGERVSIHCLHTHPDDSAILDSFAMRSAEQIIGCLEDKYAKSEELKKSIQGLTDRLRSLVEVRLLSQPQLAIYDLFEKHPLHDSLDSINLIKLCSNPSKTIGLSEQQLTVLILGCGAYGTEALKSVFWLGRFASTRLKIVVVEKDDVRQKMERLFLECPGLMSECTYSENPLGPREGKWSIASRHSERTVRFCEMDVFGANMRALVSGQDVQAMWYELDKDGTPGIVDGKAQLIGPEDHLYCLICLSDDDSTLNAALDLQRSLSMRKLRAKGDSSGVEPVAGRRENCVPIALRVRSELTLTTGQAGMNGLQSDLHGLGFPLYPFGSLASVFSYETIADDKAELRAIHTNAAYANAHRNYPSLRMGRMEYYGLKEIYRMSNRSCALSIPYKLWTLGLKKDVTVKDFQNAVGGGETPETNDDFRKALVLPKTLVDGTTQGPSGDEWTVNEQSDDEFRRNWPLLAYLADTEHVRWCAFYRSLGWRDTLSALDESNADLTREALGSEDVNSTLKNLEKVRQRLPLRKGTQSIDLRLHYYLCDNIDELRIRGKDCDDHPFAYDRIITWLGVNIINRTVCQ